MGSTFLDFSLAYPRHAATGEASVADGERGCHCSSWLQLVLQPCWRGLLWSKVTVENKNCSLRWRLHEKAREDFGRRLPSPRGLLTVCRVAMLVRCQLGRGEEKRASVRRYLFVRSWPSETSAVRVFPLSCSEGKENGVRMSALSMCACVHMAVHECCVTIALSTRKQLSGQQRGGTSSILCTDKLTYLFWRLSGSQRLSKYFVNATPKTALTKYTSSNASCIHTHCKPVDPSSPHQRHCLQYNMDFLLSLSKGRNNHTYTNDNVPLVTRLAQPLLWPR